MYVLEIPIQIAQIVACCKCWTDQVKSNYVVALGATQTQFAVRGCMLHSLVAQLIALKLLCVTPYVAKYPTLLQRDNIRTWWEYLPNAAEPRKSAYRCKLCHKYYDQFKLDPRYKTSFAREEGQLRNTKRKNRDEISQHGTTPGHRKVVEELQRHQKHMLPGEFALAQSKSNEWGDHSLEITNRMTRTVYTEAFKNIPYSSHPTMVQLQRENGLDLGSHHDSRFGAAAITKFISEQMHMQLLHSLCEEDMPVSIIVDSATDLGQRHYLVMLIQTIEKGRAMTSWLNLGKTRQPKVILMSLSISDGMIGTTSQK